MLASYNLFKIGLPYNRVTKSRVTGVEPIRSEMAASDERSITPANCCHWSKASRYRKLPDACLAGKD
ncbi:hypothetical protein OPT61_g449 [Boeremia exigua]|uniref:Uncharacterized protein n=1 Tax=Boeremia exigua TaxID=749465 RepID=A0ACC2IU98_9PLEO|nr:hypothetical protein OPT61_g449 [Boeremia exigua]